MTLERYSNSSEVARRAADIVADLVTQKPDAVLLLPAGDTPVALYAELLRRHSGGELDLSRAHIFQLDELIGVGPDDERSFNHFLRKKLVDPLRRDGRRDHLLEGTAEDPVFEIEQHAARLKALGEADLVLLGIGRNGHVAFNEPGTGPGECGRVVDLAAATVAGLRGSFPADGPPTTGITLGLKEISAARRVVLLATGESKSEVLASLLHSEPSSECPASLLLSHAEFLILSDQDAAHGIDTHGIQTAETN